MSIREHVSVFIAIVIGLAVSVLAMNFYRLAVAGKRVAWDWLSPLLAVLMLLVIVNYWWASFDWFVARQTLTVGAFLPYLANVLLLFLAVAGVLPETVPARGLDLRRFYFERAPFVYGMLALGVAEASVLNVYRDGDYSAAGIASALNVNPLFTAMFAALIFVRRVWVHGVILVVALTGSAAFNLSEAITN